ncbi:spermidine/putrescine ABC transporter permease [Prosthecomicrobium hirschii]|uniref:Spermidine/putrescine ABC transporter permease n=1 Tax=Prosthecodimorpha hirschii TaxID=665126 RepID=A0A0P6W8E3_9HYPH|nr:ABC transporter permease [Prosthecomicrobium hirschii]KPL54870.1 spermidine/putrescine ABC transporter permease [Prosthecomicrobium hirschii]
MTRSEGRAARIVLDVYIGLFLVYLFAPLVVMSVAAFNAYPYPSVTQWRGFTLEWFPALFRDERLMRGLFNSIVIALGVIALSIPFGLAGALVLHRLQSRAGGLLYAIMVSPVLMPGLIIGLSTLIFWRHFSVPGGLFLAMVAQASFIASYCMLMFLARLERFDLTLEEAALDLGASKFMVMRRILFPYLRPTAITASAIAFLQSFENYNTTVFSIGGDWTLVTEVGSRLRFGLSPVVNVVGVVFVVLTVAVATLYVLLSRRHVASDARAS